MPNFTHRISNPAWNEAYLVDELEPEVAYSEVDGTSYHSGASWLDFYKGDRPRFAALVERIGHINLENK